MTIEGDQLNSLMKRPDIQAAHDRLAKPAWPQSAPISSAPPRIGMAKRGPTPPVRMTSPGEQSFNASPLIPDPAKQPAAPYQRQSFRPFIPETLAGQEAAGYKPAAPAWTDHTGEDQGSIPAAGYHQEAKPPWGQAKPNDKPGAAWRVGDSRGMKGSEVPASMPRYTNAQTALGRPVGRLTRAANPNKIRIGGGDPNAAGRQMIIDHIDQAVAAAHATGDHAAVAAHFARRSALDQGGFEGLARHDHEAAMNSARREEVGARTDLATSRTGRPASDPSQAEAEMFKKTGNAEAASVAGRMARHASAMAQFKAGGVHSIEPQDIEAAIDERYPHVKTHLSAEPGNGDLHQRYAEMKAAGVPGFDDPRSEIAQIYAARMRQAFGTEMPNQLFVPKDPRATYSFPHHKLPGPLDGLLRGFDAHIGGLMQGHPTLDPQKDYDQRAAAAAHYSKILKAK